MAKVPDQSSRGEARDPVALAAGIGQRDATSTSHGSGGESGRSAESRLVIRGPVSGRMLSSFTLPDCDGRAVSLWNYLQRLNVVLFFHHGANCGHCRDVLHELSANAAAYRDEEAIVLAIGPDHPPLTRQLANAVACPFPLLSDPAGHAIARQNLDVPALLVSDRFGEIWAAWDGGNQHLLPDGREIKRWLEFVELQCPECGVAEWPPLPSGVLMD